MSRVGKKYRLAGMLIMTVVCILLVGASEEGSPAGSEKDPLSILGVRATEGAAAGYVPDRACATCHPDLYKSYQHVGMSQSLRRTGNEREIESFGKEFYHEASDRYYTIRKEGEGLVFRRYQKDAAGKEVNVFETGIDWVMGSGNRARSYLYQTEWGEIYMLPIGWYSEDKVWGMSPGFESPKHLGVRRIVPRECMFCHNALPEVAEKTDFHWEPDLFPKELPEGTGCQRCHGPGADHIRTVLSAQPLDKIRGSIVNPAKLDPVERDSVCFQCHMLPTVSMVGARHFDRPDYSFRPGQNLTDYLVHVDTREPNVTREDRFEINHHGYRFWQSACYQESEGALACITCHDPHVKPESKAFRAKISGEVCLDCHSDQREKHQPTLASMDDCVSCHMPTRRTRDVVLVTMTDHRIARGPFDHEALVKSVDHYEPKISGLDILDFGGPPTGDEAELYRIASVMRTRPMGDAVNAMNNIFARKQVDSPVPYLDFLEGQLNLKQYAEGEKTAKYMLHRWPDFHPAYGKLGVAQVGQDRVAEGIASFKKALSIQETPETNFNLGLAYFRIKKDREAIASLKKAIEMRPNFHQAWLYLGRAHAGLKEWDAAKAAMIRSLEVEPANTPSYEKLVKLLRHLGQSKEAERYLELGLRAAWDPEELEPLRSQVQKED